MEAEKIPNFCVHSYAMLVSLKLGIPNEQCLLNIVLLQLKLTTQNAIKILKLKLILILL